jgi:aspartyl/asparaginyl-tRNA synthetase
MTNPGVRDIFITRARIISYVRRYFDDRGFLEVLSLHPAIVPLYLTGSAVKHVLLTYGCLYVRLPTVSPLHYRSRRLA